MAISARGAWYLPGRAYRPGLRGTDGESLSSDSDNLGWACVGWKRALAHNGFAGAMVPDAPMLGTAAGAQIEAAQRAFRLTVDRAIGEHTGERLLRVYFIEQEELHGLPKGTLWQVGAQESNFDLGAVGYVDPDDRGSVQTHIYVRSDGSTSILLSQAIRPGSSIARLGSQVARVLAAYDLDVAVASWNVGEGGAEWWARRGKPTHGSPDATWWKPEWGDLSERCWRYLGDVRSHRPPY